MKKYFISILILLSVSFAGQISPEDNAELNYRHVLFEWEQVPNASEYQISIMSLSTAQWVTVTTESLQYILSDLTFLNWQNYYIWNVTPIYDDGSLGDTMGNLTFYIGPSRSSAYTNQYNSEAYSDGITIFSSFFDYYSAAIDESGNEIWNSGDENIVYYNTDYFGLF